MTTPRYRLQLVDNASGVVLCDATVVGVRLTEQLRQAMLDTFPLPEQYRTLTLKIEGLEQLDADL